VFNDRLENQGSPYLQDHAYDLVEWQLWSQSSFDRALKENKPIFLSIGYKSCHWCKVLQEESFQDPTIASMINESFIPIIVDKEQFPQVDRLYMDFAQLLLQHSAGWPLNLILTPQKIPFYAFTYLPPISMDGMVGLNDILVELVYLWNGEDKEHILQQTQHLLQIYQEASICAKNNLPNKSVQIELLNTIFDHFDQKNGGFEGELKFPLSYQIDHLIHFSEIFEDQRPLYFAELTLDKQALSPLFDPIFGGFRRYAADAKRREPHFEKMLVDNAFLMQTYAHMYQETSKVFYKQVALKIFAFIENYLKVDFGYGSAQSADHGGQEGGSALFSWDELEDLLDEEELQYAKDYLGATKEGILEGYNIPFYVSVASIEPNEIHTRIVNKLKNEIFQRANIEIDSKIVLSANAILATSLMKTGCYLSMNALIDKGVDLLKTLIDRFSQNGRFRRCFADSLLSGEALLEDLTALVSALLNAFETGKFAHGYRLALELVQQIEEQFGSQEGGFFSTIESDPCVVRIKPFLDGAEPSANATMAQNYLKLFGISHRVEFLKKAEAILQFGVEKLLHHPQTSLTLFSALLHYQSKDKKTIFLKKDLQDNAVYCFCHPFTCVVVCHPELIQMIPAVEGKTCINNKTTVYVCTASSCSEPIDDLEKLGVPWNRVI
jgi:uncharacterized protein YyaL (SSP411 family)